MRTDVLIIGAGITGLSCAYHLKRDYIVLEKELSPGGACQTDKIEGFSFDRGEHFIRVPNRKILEFFHEILGSNFYKQKLISSIYYDNNFIPYPFQKNIYYLSDRDKLRCLKSFIKIKSNSRLRGGRSFGQWILSNYGEGISNMFMLPYNEKIWRTNPFKMRSDFSFDPALIPEISIDEILKYALLSQEERKENEIQNRHYLKRGGIGLFSNRLASKIKNIHYNKEIVKIDLKRKEAISSDGITYDYKSIISTIPLVELIKIIDDDIPLTMKKASKQLKYNSICIFNFALKREIDLSEHWIYFPEPEVPFVRAYILKNFNSMMCPKGKSSISVIYTYLPNERNNFSIIEKRIVNYFSRHGILSINDIQFKFRQSVKYGMVIPIIGSDKIVKKIDKFLISHSVKTIGRYGLWKYQGMEHAIQDGQNINSILKDLKL